jgi:hypothetical protein
MLDRRRGLDGIIRVLCANTLRKRNGRHGNAEQPKPARKRCFQHSILLLDSENDWNGLVLILQR